MLSQCVLHNLDLVHVVRLREEVNVHGESFARPQVETNWLTNGPLLKSGARTCVKAILLKCLGTRLYVLMHRRYVEVRDPWPAETVIRVGTRVQPRPSKR